MNIFNKVKFPIWKNDGKASVVLNKLQRSKIQKYQIKIQNKEYKLVSNPCLCGFKYNNSDIIITEKDRYGIDCANILCIQCGLIRLSKKLDDESTDYFYQNDYRDIYVGKAIATNEFFKEQEARGIIFIELLQKYIKFEEIGSVFEVGCGAGGILYPFYKKGIKASGCDFGETYLKYGRSKKLQLYHGGITDSPISEQSQDLIVLSHVMEHFNHPIESLNEIIKYVKPNKYLLIEVPGIFIIDKHYLNPIYYFQNAHVYNYYYYFLNIFFEKIGLEVIYGDERCTFILKKPKNWQPNKSLDFSSEDYQGFSFWVEEIQYYIKKQYVIDKLKLSSIYYKHGVIKVLNILGVKDLVKKIIRI